MKVIVIFWLILNNYSPRTKNQSTKLWTANLDMCFFVDATDSIMCWAISLGLGSPSFLSIWTNTTPLQPVSRKMKRFYMGEKIIKLFTITGDHSHSQWHSIIETAKSIFHAHFIHGDICRYQMMYSKLDRITFIFTLYIIKVTRICILKSDETSQKNTIKLQE